MAFLGSRSSSDMPMEYYIERPKGVGSRAVLKKTDEEMKRILADLNAAMKKGSDNFKETNRLPYSRHLHNGRHGRQTIQ